MTESVITPQQAPPRTAKFTGGTAELLVAFRWPFAIIVFVLALIFLRTPENSPVVLPMLATLFVATLFFDILRVREHGASPFFQIGGFYGAMVLLYAIYPLIVYLAGGMRYGPLNDNRLYAYPPTPSQVGALAWWYVAYFAAFCAAYLLVSRGGGTLRATEPARGSMIVVLAILLAVFLILRYGITWYFGLGGNYHESYGAVQQLPLIARQIFARVVGILPALKLIFLAFLFTRYKKSRAVILLYLGVMLVLALRRLGARTEVFLLFIAALVLYHHLVRRIGFFFVVTVGSFGLALFTFLGFLRGLRGVTSISLTNIFLSSSEFETIFANAYSLRHIHDAAGAFRGQWTLYFADLYGVVPQQLLPFPKTIAANWFMATYYPVAAEHGAGSAFGVIAEGMVGYGVMDVIVRGLFIGLIFGWVHRHFTSAPASPWMIALYAWLTVHSYQAVRNTTLALLPWVILQFFVPALVVIVLHYLLVRTGRGMRAALR